MNVTEQTNPAILPLAEAAAHLGVTPDALRMRMKRGRAQGFKRGGRVFVYVGEGTGGPVRPRPEHSEQTAPERAGQSEQASRTELPPEPAFPVVIEFQKIELTRLLRENNRLNQRLDRLMDEFGHLRELQQREQVLRQHEQGLRQQEQDLRQQLQITVDRLTERLALPSPPIATGGALSEGLGHQGAPPAVPEPAEPAAPAAPAARPGTDLTAAPPPPPEAITRVSPEAIAPVPPTRRPEKHTRPPADDPVAAELADILREVGQSLRDFETSPAEPPPAPGGRDALDKKPDPLDGMLSQLDSSEEDRRSTARIMKRLFRNRNGPGRRDP